MKTKNNYCRLILFVFLLGLTFFTSCSKERIESQKEEQLNSYQSVNSYYDTKKQDEQEFTIDTAGTSPIVGHEGTKIYGSKDLLMFPNGDSVQWPYTVKLVELYTPKDMLYYQMPTIAAGSLLFSDGEVRVRAFKDGQELVLRPGRTWLIEMPETAPAANMKIYYGVESSSLVDWTPNPAGNFTTTAYGYSANIAKLGWVSCAKPATVSATTTNYTFSSTTDDLQNVSKFIYFSSAKSLMQVYGNTSGNLPIGENIKIILIGINSSNQLYYYYNETQVSTSNQINLSLGQISDADLTAILNAL